MGRHTDPAVAGSRRATVLTLSASALLLAGGFTMLGIAGDQRLGPVDPPVPSVDRTSRIDGVSETGRRLPQTPAPSASRHATAPPAAPSRGARGRSDDMAAADRWAEPERAGSAVGALGG
jgi:hypothetical protein